ncbi:MAG: O-antigen ligase family protein [Thermodesulfobacteriota bacterium]
MSLAANLMATTRRPALADVFYRLARISLLVMLFILPLEAITALREITMVAATLFLGLHFWSRGQFRFRATALLWPLVFYVATAVLSLLTAVDFAYSLKELRAEVLKGVIIFYTAVHFVEDEQPLGQAWGAMLLGLTVMTVAGLILFVHQGGSLFNYAVRAGSLHSGYGTLGTYLAMVWPYLLLARRAWPQPRWRWPWLGLTAATALLAYATYNRAAWLAMVVETGLCLLILSRRRLRVALIMAAACLAALAVLFLAPGSRHGEEWSHLLKDPLKTGGTAGDLLSAWRYSLHRLQEKPFQGIGLGRHSFSKAFPDFRRTHQPLLWHAHNTFVDQALQLGVQGLAALLLIMAVLLASLWPRSPPEAGAVGQAFMAATAAMVVGFCLRNLFDDFFVDDTGMLFWLLSGLALGVKGLAAQRRMA